MKLCLVFGNAFSILHYHFREKSVSKINRIISETSGEHILSHRTCQSQFQRFRNVDLSFYSTTLGHIASMTKDNLLKLKWEILPQPPYSPDLAAHSDFHLFRSMQN